MRKDTTPLDWQAWFAHAEEQIRISADERSAATEPTSIENLLAAAQTYREMIDAISSLRTDILERVEQLEDQDRAQKMSRLVGTYWASRIREDFYVKIDRYDIKGDALCAWAVRLSGEGNTFSIERTRLRHTDMSGYRRASEAEFDQACAAVYNAATKPLC